MSASDGAAGRAVLFVGNGLLIVGGSSVIGVDGWLPERFHDSLIVCFFSLGVGGTAGGGMTAESGASGFGRAGGGDMSDACAGGPVGDILDGVATGRGEVAVNGFADPGPLLETDGVLIFNFRVFLVPSIVHSLGRDDIGKVGESLNCFESELGLRKQASGVASVRVLVFLA